MHLQHVTTQPVSHTASDHIVHALCDLVLCAKFDIFRCLWPPPALYRCTRLTSLDLNSHRTIGLSTLFTVGNAEAITALQRLQFLRLGGCVTAPLTQGISRLTRLLTLEVLYTSIGHAYDPMELVVRCSTTLRMHFWQSAIATVS